MSYGNTFPWVSVWISWLLFWGLVCFLVLIPSFSLGEPPLMYSQCLELEWGWIHTLTSGEDKWPRTAHSECYVPAGESKTMRTMSVSSGLDRTIEKEKLSFPWAYETKVREEALWEKSQKRETELRDFWEHVWTPPAIPHASTGVALYCVNLAKLHYISQNPLHYMFLVRVEHKRHSAWGSEGRVKAAISFLFLKALGRGTRYCCSPCTLSFISDLPLFLWGSSQVYICSTSHKILLQPHQLLNHCVFRFMTKGSGFLSAGPPQESDVIWRWWETDMGSSPCSKVPAHVYGCQFVLTLSHFISSFPSDR